MTVSFNFSHNLLLFHWSRSTLKQVWILVEKSCGIAEKTKVWQTNYSPPRSSLYEKGGKKYFPIVYDETYLYPGTLWWKQYGTLNQTVKASSSQIIGLSSNFFFGRIDEFTLTAKDYFIFCEFVENEYADSYKKLIIPNVICHSFVDENWYEE
jgi:hypothetical protein